MRSAPLLSLILFVASCGSPEPALPDNLAAISGTWTWVGDPAAGGRIPTLTIATDGKVHGNGGVNRFNSFLDRTAVARGEWALDGITVTRMAGTEPAMALEQRLLDALTSADSVRVGGDVLELGRSGTALVSFRRTWAR